MRSGSGDHEIGLCSKMGWSMGSFAPTEDSPRTRLVINAPGHSYQQSAWTPQKCSIDHVLAKQFLSTEVQYLFMCLCLLKALYRIGLIR